MKTTTDAIAMLHDLIGDDPELQDMVAEESSRLDVAALIYNARTGAGLTQKQLAERAGTTQPAIARMENADYDGHSLSMLRRIADSLGLKVEIKLLPRMSDGYHPGFVEETAEPCIRFVTQQTRINAAAYSSTTWSGDPWRPGTAGRVG